MTFRMRMKKKSKAAAFRNRTRAASLGLALALAPAVAACAPAAAAQSHGPVQRVLDGKVVDKNDKPITGAVVYLKDSKTMSVKSYLTDEEGHFRFGQLSQNIDYEVWAEQNGVHSKSKNISSFDNRNDFHFVLKISK